MLLLTTHSMEEADTLGDRIAVFAGGRLRCLGTSLHLKARHGSGYRLSIGLRPDSAAAAVNSMAAASHDEPSCSGAAGASASGSSSSSGGTSAVAAQAGQQARLAVEQLVSQVLGQPVEAEAAGELGLQFQLPAGCEARLAEVLQQLQLRAEQLGVADVQVSLRGGCWLLAASARGAAAYAGMCLAQLGEPARQCVLLACDTGHTVRRTSPFGLHTH